MTLASVDDTLFKGSKVNIRKLLLIRAKHESFDTNVNPTVNMYIICTGEMFCLVVEWKMSG